MPVRILRRLMYVALYAISLPSVAFDLPLTPAGNTVDTYFGTQVADPYRWLEDMKSDAFQTWTRAQANYAEETLARIPARDALKARLTELSNAAETVSALRLAGGRQFYLKLEPGRNARRLFVRETDGRETLLVDPEVPSPTGRQAIDFFSPSFDGRLLAVGLSAGGSEDSVLRILDVGTGAWLPDAIDGAGLNEGGVGWRADGRSFFYNRLPPADQSGRRERYAKSVVREHVIGQPPAQDKPVLGYGVTIKRHFAAPDVPFVRTMPDSNYALAIVLHGDSVDRSFYVAPLSAINGPDTPWRRIAGPPDQINEAALHGSQLYLLSHKNAPRYKLLKLDLARPVPAVTPLRASRRVKPAAKKSRHAPRRVAVAPLAIAPAGLARAKVVVMPGTSVLRNAVAAADALYVRRLDGGVGSLLRVPFNDGPSSSVPLPFEGAIRELAADPGMPGVTLKLESWTESPRYFRVSDDGEVRDSGLLKPSPVSFAGIESTRQMVKSQDGTMVPLTVIRKKGLKLDGSNPAILYAYGAYGFSVDPSFSPMRLAWLERGGVYAIAHVRGGGEFGEEWHAGAHILNKANTIRDYIACAEQLVRDGYTSPQKLAGVGGSAGGIAVGGAITQRPDLFAAAHAAVGIADMLRMELTPNGPPNIAEFGTVMKKNQFTAMSAISPYHQVRKGVAYPAVILTTGINDPRVDTWQPAKFAAALQSASANAKPVLLRVDYDAGHGIGSTRAQAIGETADVWSFFLWQMNSKDFLPAP